MMYGLTGAHRAGKTTAARAVAERMGLSYRDGSFGKLAARMGYRSVDAMTIEERIEMQERCLALHLADLADLGTPCVTDRTPLDYIGYAVAEVGMHAGLPSEISARIDAYVGDCIAATRKHYRALALLAPLPTYAADDGKPSACIAYQSHIQLLIEGALYRIGDALPVLRVTTHDREDRVRDIAEGFSRAMG